VRVVYDGRQGPDYLRDTPQSVVVSSRLRLIITGRPNPRPDHFDIIRMDKPWAEESFLLDKLGEQALYGSTRFYKDSSGTAYVLFIWRSGGLGKLVDTPMAIRLKDGKQMKLPWTVYRDVEITGGTHGYAHSEDWMYLRQYKDGRLWLPLGGLSVVLDPELPPFLRFEPQVIPQLQLQNPFMRVFLDGQPAPSKPEGLGGVSYRVYERTGLGWRSFNVPGNLSKNLRAFGPWIAGMVEEGALGAWRQLTPAMITRNYARPRISPGSDEREQEDRLTGVPIDRYLEGMYYRPGMLFLYQVQTGRYYEWDTHQGDSEILLVEGDQVYYRVNRRIYRAAIGEKTIGKPELVVKGDVVPDIHWVFFGPKLPPDYKLPEWPPE